MKERILSILEQTVAVQQQSIASNTEAIIKAAELIAAAVTSGHKVLLFGNGGSAADAQHIAAEFVNRFQIERPPLAAAALTTDTSIITAVGNDYSFDDIFLKQIQALGLKGDVAVGISTSGNSPNVVKGIIEAKAAGLHTIGLTGPGGELARQADLALAVNADRTARIQETHIIMGHIICDLVETMLFSHNTTTGASS